ncbi:UDP-N-acetylmuramyl pentapeptide synthase [Methanohalophilus levihalophilus]|uniref:coenzyme F430 synthase n=1 Tax=Methanohalophilus levihalophilus TaxID=1431282 RepID=UPI001AE542FB|nr:coenzyme F430 synthase [Methanohalophilus levihalophilus]MBP2029173.1 UDP-N-acetylmuramyl pentapeptide synthase [Methanohalophilus levihalophilus]
MNTGQQKYTVLDMTHGGVFIAKALAKLGSNVRAVDVYGSLKDEGIAGLQTSGIEVTEKNPAFSENDIVVVPVHLDPDNPVHKSALESGAKIITHHEAVEMILSKTGKLKEKQVFEITGSRGKTSTAFLLAAILSKEKTVVLHTSGGLYYLSPTKKELLRKGLSIAPASILEAVSTVEEEEISVDAFIFEDSLGGTGIADIGIITTLEPEYGIANNKRNSSDAKLQMVRNAKPDSKIVLNCIDLERAENSTSKSKISTFSSDGECNADVEIKVSSDSLVLKSGNENIKIVLQSGYDPKSYSMAFAAAACAALEAGISTSTIANAFADFSGVEGRMRITSIQGRKLVDNSSSGLKIEDAETALIQGADSDKKVVLIIGEHAAQVCEGLPPEEVECLLEKYADKIDVPILVGERMEDTGTDKAIYCSSLEEGITTALELTSENDIIISCVKCFR